MRLAWLTLVAVLALGASAQAAPTRLQRAMRIADSYFPNSPCHGRVAVYPATDGVVSQSGAEAGAVALQSSCVVLVAWDRWDGAPWRQACRMLVHEYGHLAGLDHSTDRASVMFPTLFDIAQGSERCWLAFPDPFAFYSRRDLRRARARAFLAAHPGWRQHRGG